ncbi:MAG: DNA adenine methylase [Enterocloster sp.]
MGRYIEVFGGAGWVLFAKEKQAGQLEVYNDRDGNLVNLYRCIKYHCSALQEELHGFYPLANNFMIIKRRWI